MPGDAQNGFDGRMAAKLIALLDSGQDGEAAAALYRLRTALKKSGMKFFEAVEAREYKTAIWETFRPECLRDYFEGKQGGSREADTLRAKIARLEAEYGEVVKRLAETEQAGADLADAVEQQEKISEGLRGENIWLKDRIAFCRECESKRRWIAAVIGLVMLGLWSFAVGRFSLDLRLAVLGLPVAAMPVGIVCCRWRYVMFKRDYRWVSWRDNDIYRMAAAKWNRFLGRLAMS